MNTTSKLEDQNFTSRGGIVVVGGGGGGGGVCVCVVPSAEEKTEERATISFGYILLSSRSSSRFQRVTIFRAALRSKPRGASRFRSVSFSCNIFVRRFSSA